MRPGTKSKSLSPVTVLSLLLGLLAVSFSAIFVEWSSAPASVVGMYRLWLSVVFFLPLAWKQRRQLLALSGRDWLRLSLSGLFLGLHFLFWMQSLRETSVASSMIILALEPVFVLLGSLVLFRHGSNRQGVFSMLFAILGCVIVACADLGKGGHHLLGDFLSFVGTIAVSLYMLTGQTVRQTVPSTLYNSIVFFVAGFVLFIVNVATGTPLGTDNGRNWLMFGLLAVVSTVLGHGIFNWLLNKVSALTIAMTILSEPVGAILLARLLLGQPIHTLQSIGGAICLISVFYFLKMGASEQRDHKEHPASEKTQSA